MTGYVFVLVIMMLNGDLASPGNTAFRSLEACKTWEDGVQKVLDAQTPKEHLAYQMWCLPAEILPTSETST